MQKSIQITKECHSARHRRMTIEANAKVPPLVALCLMTVVAKKMEGICFDISDNHGKAKFEKME